MAASPLIAAMKAIGRILMSVISKAALDRRVYWIGEIERLSGNFSEDSERLEGELGSEVAQYGATAIIDHLRLCGDIPESYTHDSSEEKLYSKYTDALLCESYKLLGMRSLVLRERADAADVEAFGREFSFVADAKAFRLSRTAKNQKDFKVQAMDGWKRGKPFAMVVCPIYQLPTRSSQIYEQASSRNVCIFTYSHLAVLVEFSIIEGQARAEELMHQVFQTIPALNPSKDASSYWLAVNRTMLQFSREIEKLWRQEKRAALESIQAAKHLALTHLALEREKIMRMTHQEALRELISVHKIESKVRVISAVTDTGVLEIR